ncbi:MAG: OPT family oligopeptide transporter [Planctomycetes bacterium]|nr:OPT family oligopeptide transporter [Planctomycetota bacterium]
MHEPEQRDPEAHWLRQTRKIGVPQLTARAVIVGMALGCVMCISNLYVFFKTGWSMGVTITAAILAFSLFRGLQALRVVKEPLTTLENNALTTVASGAGYMTGGGNMAAYGALLMMVVTHQGLARPATVPMIGWFALIAALGVFAAIPIKRQLINKEQLAFPTGTATAETLETLHGGSAGEGALKARALAIAAAGAALLTWLREAKAAWMPFNVPAKVPLGFSIAGRKAAEWTLELKSEVVLLGAGALMSFRTAWSLLLGSVLTYGLLAPALVADGVITTISYKKIVEWTVWPGASMLVASGLASFLFDYRSVVRSFSGLARIFGRGGGAQDPMDDVECPAWWFPAGFLVLAPIVVFLMGYLFAIPWWAGVIAVPLAVVMGFIAARVTGDTDVTPTKALGPVTQGVFGALVPGNLAGNIMSANVTGGIGLHAADLLTTLKTGWLLGGNPRVQFYAQLFGVAAGAALIVPAFKLLIPDPAALGTDEWPAPGCLVWAGVSEIFVNGFAALGSEARVGILVGATLGLALALLEKLAPKGVKPFVPSPSGLGIAMVIPGSNGLAMFLGGALAELVRRQWRTLGERFIVPVASGLIAGESLMGVGVIALKVSGYLSM